MSNPVEKIENPEKDKDENNFSDIRMMLLISFGSALITLIIYVLWFEPLKTMRHNQVQIEQQREQLAELQETVKVSREELAKQLEQYIEDNYGDTSERDESIAKLEIYFKQQDARLSNIEEALSKF